MLFPFKFKPKESYHEAPRNFGARKLTPTEPSLRCRPAAAKDLSSSAFAGPKPSSRKATSATR